MSIVVPRLSSPASTIVIIKGNKQKSANYGDLTVVEVHIVIITVGACLGFEDKAEASEEHTEPFVIVPLSNFQQMHLVNRSASFGILLH